MDFVAACKNLKKDKPCTIKFVTNASGTGTDTEKKQKTWHFWRTGIVRIAEASATVVSAGRSKDTNPLVCLCTQPGQLVFPLSQRFFMLKALKILVLKRL
ncbi:unnamed protein product [Camellia sinensis]